jgi:hypothetical protein
MPKPSGNGWTAPCRRACAARRSGTACAAPAGAEALSHGDVLGADYRIQDEGAGLLKNLGADGLGRVGWTVLEATAERLRVRVPASARPSNILKLLESAGCADPLASGLAVTRERCWAAGSAGGPVSYFELDFPS